MTTILSVCLLYLASNASCQQTSDSTYLNSSAGFDNFFDQTEALFITLEFDLKQLQRLRKDERYVPARLSLNEAHNDENYDVRIKTRGTFRKSFCSLPPFWLNINNSGISSPSLEGIKKIKVVSHCMKSSAYQDFVLKEYLAYKLYQIISPYSFKVRLLKIKYIDTGRNSKISEGWGFAIEPVETLAERLDAVIIENTELSMARMNPTIMDRLSLYYYMTGNTDFSITGMHNVKFIRLNYPGPIGTIPVPYDFDFTGFVNASYATPADNVPLEKVTERYYVGPCRPEKSHQVVISEFKEKSHEIHSLLQSFDHMDLEEKMKMLRYIESFFDEINQDDFIQNKINASCK